VLLLAFSVWWGYHTANLPSATMANAPGPRFFPWVLVGALALLSLLLLITSLKTGADESRRPEANGGIGRQKLKKHVAVFFIIFIYIVLVENIGFRLATFPILLIILRLVMGQKSWVVGIGTAAGITMGIYLVFRVLLGVPLPSGNLW